MVILIKDSEVKLHKKFIEDGFKIELSSDKLTKINMCYKKNNQTSSI